MSQSQANFKHKHKHKHRPICDVLEEIKGRASSDSGIKELCDEALIYAKSMQARLQQNKQDMIQLAFGKLAKEDE